MYILVKDDVAISEIKKANIAIKISDDGKSFVVMKHDSVPNIALEKYHMSHLRNVLLAK